MVERGEGSGCKDEVLARLKYAGQSAIRGIMACQAQWPEPPLRAPRASASARATCGRRCGYDDGDGRASGRRSHCDREAFPSVRFRRALTGATYDYSGATCHYSGATYDYSGAACNYSRYVPTSLIAQCYRSPEGDPAGSGVLERCTPGSYGGTQSRGTRVCVKESVLKG